MQVSISARHGKLTDSVHDKIQEKAAKLPRYFERITAVQVTIDLEHDGHAEAEIRVSAEKTADFVATEKAETTLSAFDGALHKVERQLRRHKDKVRGHRVKPQNYEQAAETPPSDEED